MKKLTLNETIERIRQLTYGNIYEQSVNLNEQKIDEPKKADLVTDDIENFYKTLLSNTDGLTQQKTGSMQYQKSVESMQIGLILLGYKLPTHGVDGLYGPETNQAVLDFNKKNGIQDTFASFKTLQKIVELLKQKGISSEDIKPHIDKSGDFTDIDLTTPEGFEIYANNAQKYIDTKKNNFLRITGKNLAEAAKKTFEKYNKYVPLELALAQLTLEGGFSNDPNSKPIRTNNPYNIGNVDSGGVRGFSDVQSGIDAYYDVIARRYIGNGKTASNLINNFVDLKGARYASSDSYESNLNKIISDINKITSNNQTNKNAFV